MRIVAARFWRIKNTTLSNIHAILTSKMSTHDAVTAKQLASFQAVDDNIMDGQVVGIGSGSTIVFAVQRIAEKISRQELKDIICVPTSFQARDLIIENKLRLSDLDVHYPVDVTIDGCDECDAELNLIKGGGGCHLQEKMVAAASKKLVIVGDYTKESKYLGENWKKGIPLEVCKIGWKIVADKLRKFHCEEVTCGEIRNSVRKMGPVVTDNNNFIIDFKMGNLLQNEYSPKEMDRKLREIPGVLETGLFVNMASAAYFGQKNGTVKKIVKAE